MKGAERENSAGSDPAGGQTAARPCSISGTPTAAETPPPPCPCPGGFGTAPGTRHIPGAGARHIPGTRPATRRGRDARSLTDPQQSDVDEEVADGGKDVAAHLPPELLRVHLGPQPLDAEHPGAELGPGPDRDPDPAPAPLAATRGGTT